MTQHTRTHSGKWMLSKDVTKEAYNNPKNTFLELFSELIKLKKLCHRKAM